VTVQAPAVGVAAQASSVQGGLPKTGVDGLLLWGLAGAGALALGVTSTVVVRRNQGVVAAN
jgi:LPXTG-motif cell wall-anchored protein